MKIKIQSASKNGGAPGSHPPDPSISHTGCKAMALPYVSEKWPERTDGIGEDEDGQGKLRNKFFFNVEVSCDDFRAGAIIVEDTGEIRVNSKTIGM